jgi:hypothetical protein
MQDDVDSALAQQHKKLIDDEDQGTKRTKNLAKNLSDKAKVGSVHSAICACGFHMRMRDID